MRHINEYINEAQKDGVQAKKIMGIYSIFVDIEGSEFADYLSMGRAKPSGLCFDANLVTGWDDQNPPCWILELETIDHDFLVKPVLNNFRYKHFKKYLLIPAEHDEEYISHQYSDYNEYKAVLDLFKQQNWPGYNDQNGNKFKKFLVTKMGEIIKDTKKQDIVKKIFDLREDETENESIDKKLKHLKATAPLLVELLK